MGSRATETLAGASGIDVVALDRYTMEVPDPCGLLLGFAAFNEVAIRKGLARLATALTIVHR